MKTGLSAVMMLHNGEKIRYPWRQSLLSIMPVCEEVIVVLAGPHDDDTVNAVWQFTLKRCPDNKITIIHGEDNCTPIHYNETHWLYRRDVKWPTDFRELSHLVNIGVEYVATPWTFQAQSDELFDEADYPELLKLPTLEDRYMAASFGFRHFCGDFHHTFPFVYERVVRAYRIDSSYHFEGDAVQASGIGEVYPANITVNHLGKVSVNREQAAAFKEYDFQNRLYRGKAFDNIDPLVQAAHDAGELDFFKVFKATVDRGEVSEYNGPWCRYVREWAKELEVELP